APTRYTGSFYGAGWQWDDYNDYYQPEINELPIMDNMVTVKNTPGGLKITPKIFESSFLKDSTEKRSFKVIRDFDNNIFKIPGEVSAPISATYSQQIPYKLSAAKTIEILEDTLKKSVQLINKPMPKG